MDILKKLKARALLVKKVIGGMKLHPSYYKVEDDGLSTAEHIALDDKYIRAFVRFKVPMPEMKDDKRAEWVSDDLTCIIGMFTYNNWYSVYLKVGLGIDVAKEIIIINSQDEAEKLKLNQLIA